jgi:L-gulono-1,4-lactone dehydrogenase
MTTYAVTGGNGCLGSALVRQLLQIPQAKVRVLFRQSNGLSRSFEKQGAEIVVGDLSQVGALEALVSGADHVIHCAALTKESSGKRLLWRTNVEGTLKLARLARVAGVRHFVFVSSASVYGEGEGRFDEKMNLCQLTPSTRYARTKKAAEQLLHEELSSCEMRVTTVRPTILYGKNASWTSDVLKAIAWGIPLLPKATVGSGNFLYVEDAAKGILSLIEHRSAWGGTYNLAGHDVRWDRYFSLYAHFIGRELRRFPHSVWAILALFPFGRVYRSLVTRERVYPIGAIERNTGWKPSTRLFEFRKDLDRWAQSCPSFLNGLKPKFRSRFISKTFVEFFPAQTVAPTSLEEIQDLVRYARKEKLSLRARGATHSFSPLYATDHVLLDMREYSGVVDFTSNTVTVKAGTQLAVLMKWLEARGKCLATHGAIKSQTIAGALSTGTHGCSSAHGSLSGKLVRVKVVDGFGVERAFDRNHEWFPHFQIGLGTLGVLTEVTLEISDLIYVKESVSLLPLTQLREKSIWNTLSNSAYGFWMLYPSLGIAAQTRYQPTKRLSAAAEYRKETVSPLTIAAGKFVLPRMGATTLVGRVLRLLARAKLVRSSRKSSWGALSGVLCTEKSENSREYPLWDISLSVPKEQAEAAVQTFLEWVSQARAQRAKWYQYLAPMIQLRPQAAEAASLSASYGSDRVWIEFWVDHRLGTRDWEILRGQIHSIFHPFQYRVHWGKNCPLVPEHLDAVYPALESFRSCRSQMDPTGIFMAPYLSFLSKSEKTGGVR